MKKPKKGQSVKAEAEFEEITFVCSGCGKQVRMVKLKGLGTEGLLCQRCAEGEVEHDSG